MSVDVFKPGKSKVWHYRYQVGGVRVQRSTKLREKGAAEKVAERAHSNAVERANGGKVIPTLGELFAEWEQVRAPVASAAHRKAVDVVRRLHMYDLADLPLNALTTIKMERVRNQHLVDHRPASVNHWLRVMKLIVNWAVKREILPRLPWQVPMLKVQKRPRTILPLDVAMVWFAEVDAATTRAPFIATAIRMMFGAGLRESEAASARWEWLDWARGTYTPGVTKGREAEPIPVPQWLLDHLTPRRQPEGLIAPRADGTQLPAGFARSTMVMANMKCRTKGITPHRLRGSFATLLSEAGANIQTIQAVMRHKSPMTTMAYLEKDVRNVAAAQAKIAGKIGFVRRESGEQLQSDPYKN
jgi:integrase